VGSRRSRRRAGPARAVRRTWTSTASASARSSPASAATRQRAGLGEAAAGLASIYAFTPFGRVSKRADLGDYETTADPDRGQPGVEAPDSNPNSVLNRRRGYVAVDSGGNDLLRVRRDGEISTIATFPFRFVDAPPFLELPPGTQIPLQPVPTAVATGPDGAYYVSQLTGFPFPAGAANIYRVVPGSAPEVYASGLTNVTDLAFGRDGSLYLVEISKAGLLTEASEESTVGDVVRIAPDGEKTIVADNLASPYGLAIGRGGDLYVTVNSTSAGEGQVLRLR
jgi:sugar lactone lactonase YvrE